MTDTREEINAALAEMGEPPLGAADVVNGHGAVEDSALSPKRIHGVEPRGHKRSDLVFTNGRRVIVDLTRDELVAAVRAFNADLDGDYLEIPTIDVVGENEADAVIVRNDMMISRRAAEQIATMGHYWSKHVPGRFMNEAATDRAAADAVAGVRQSAQIGKRFKVVMPKDNGRG